MTRPERLGSLLRAVLHSPREASNPALNDQSVALGAAPLGPRRCHFGAGRLWMRVARSHMLRLRYKALEESQQMLRMYEQTYVAWTGRLAPCWNVLPASSHSPGGTMD